MYKVKVDGNTIYNPASSDLVIIDPKLTLEVNNAGEFEFVMPPTHPLYGSVERLSSVVTVEEDGSVIFEGRVTEEKTDFWKRKSYHCEGCLAYLKDTKQPPAEYHGMTVRQYLGVLLNIHNAKVSADKRFTLGAVTVTDSNDSLYRYTNWESTLQCINDDLLKSLGGYLRIRYEDGTRYLDYLAEFPNTNSQIIRFGRNLLDYASSYDSSDYCTVLIPQGAELEESEIPALHMRLGIEDVNGGSPYLVNEDAVKEHGWIERVVEWDGVTSAPVLLTKARKYLSDVQFDSMVLTIKAVDLHKLNPEIESIKLLDEIRAISKPHGMDRIFPVTKVSIPLDNASGAEYTLGTKVTYSLTSTTEAANEDILNRIKRAKTPQEILESAQDNASALIKSALNGYVVITDDASELLVMDTPDINTARKVWRWNLNGLGYSNNGYDGNYGLAITMDGAIVADYITAGTLNANLLKAGRIQDAQGYNYWDLQTGDFHLLALQNYAQKANVIIDTTPQYAVSTSSTTAPTEGWSTETPEWEEGKYVWFRLQMVNGNNQATYSAAVCIQGAKGEAGTSVTILGSYATLAELQAAHPTGALGDAYMAGNDLYVWNGTQWENVGQIRGDDGRDATQYYTYFAYATSSDGSQGFSTQPFAGAAYMGVCTVTSPTQPQTYSTYKWSQARGDKGVGVTSQVPQYYLSESSVTQTGGMWSEDEPQWQSGYYIWSRLKIEWSSGETTYTSPVLAKALNGANQKAASAESTAAYAEGTAASAETTANSAYNTATSAQTAADNAQSTADSATTKADAAQSTANTASTKADTAQSTAEGAQEAAETAQSTANTAQSTANNASTKADNAKAAADAAQETADGAREAVNTLDESLYTEEIFNRLTNNGAVQGIVMENGNLYVNASYINSGILNADLIKSGTINANLIKSGTINADLIKSGTINADLIKSGTINANLIKSGTINADLIKAGTISDAKGNNYWNLNTGEFSLSAYATNSRVDAVEATAQDAAVEAETAKSVADALDKSLDSAEVFKRLTNNGTVKGITMSEGNLYINASYINSGVLNADLMTAGIITDKNGVNYWNLDTGEFSLSALSSYATKTEVQTAQETAEAAQTTAEAAQTTANSASTTATTAKNTADSAKTTATTAKNTADSAKTTATTAKNTADSAKTTATTAKNTADSAKTTATTAKNTADSAKTTATTAKNTADDAVAAVEELDESLKTEEIFNRLTDNGKIKGITMSNGNLYVNASYINTGTLNADLIKSGTINADLIKSGTINADLIKSGTINADLIKSGTINANLIKSGTIDADLIRAGKITDSKGYNYWDLDTGEFSLAALSNYATNSRVDAVEAVAQEAEIDAETAKSVADALDKSLDSEEVFKRLTNNGKVKGITMSDGNLYINASYINSGVLNADLMTAGIITDKKKINYWDLETGEFKLSALSSYATKTEVQTAQTTAEAAQTAAGTAQTTAETAQTAADSANTAAANAQSTADTAKTTATTAKTTADSAKTTATSAKSTADAAKTTATTAKTTADSAKTTATSAKSTADAAKATADGAVAAVEELDESLKTEEIFNRLTDNGKIKGITMSNGNLYVNATYIKSGYLSANRIQGGTLKLGGSNNTYGKISIYDASGTLKGTINSGGISAQLGQFNAINIDNIDGDNSASITLNSERLDIEAGTLPVWVHNLHTNQLDVTTLGATNAYITYDNVTNLYANYVELTGDFVWWTSTAKANYVFAREARSSSPTGYTLVIPDAQIARLSFQPWNPANASTYYRPVASYGTNGNRVNYISAHSSSHSVPNSLGVNAQFGSTSAYSTKNFAPSSSDIRLKENVKDCEIEALPFIQKIRMRQFDWKENGVHQDCGFVADELEQLDENLSIGGGYNEDGTMNEKSVNDFYLVGYMVKAMQEMQAEIDYLKGVVKDGINRRVDTED